MTCESWACREGLALRLGSGLCQRKPIGSDASSQPNWFPLEAVSTPISQSVAPPREVGLGWDPGPEWRKDVCRAGGGRIRLWGAQALSFRCFLPIEIQAVGCLAVCTLSWAWCPPGVTHFPPPPEFAEWNFGSPLSLGPTQVLNLKEGSHPLLPGSQADH